MELKNECEKHHGNAYSFFERYLILEYMEGFVQGAVYEFK